MRIFGRRSGPPPGVVHDRTGDTYRLRTTTLASTGGRELEIVQIPGDLVSHTERLLQLVAARVAQEKPERDGATAGGMLLRDTQPAIHVMTLRLVSRSIEPGSDELFRIVDYGEGVASGFPRRLVATHVALLAADELSLRKREAMLRQSIALFPGEEAADSGQTEFDRGENLNNYLGWFELGDTLIDRGKREEGFRALANAAARCPAWARDFASHVGERLSAGGDDPRFEFWRSYGKR